MMRAKLLREFGLESSSRPEGIELVTPMVGHGLWPVQPRQEVSQCHERLDHREGHSEIRRWKEEAGKEERKEEEGAVVGCLCMQAALSIYSTSNLEIDYL